METKMRVNLSINTGVVAGAREKGLNLSQISEDALRAVLNTFEIQILPENCTHKWTWPFSISSGLCKECLKCGTLQKVKIESSEETDQRLSKIKLS